MEDRRDFNPDDLLDRAVDAVRRDPIPDDVPPDRVAQLAAVVQRAADQPCPMTLTKRIRNMKPMTRIAVAAAVLVAFVGLMSWLVPGRGEALALTNIAEALANIESARWKTTVVVKLVNGEAKTFHEIGMFLAPSRERKETTAEGETSIGIFDARKDKALVLVPAKKRATVMKFDESLRGGRGRTFQHLRETVVEAQSGGPARAEPVGARVIDGRRAEGFRMQTGATVVTIWADPKTSLPIRVETVLSGATEVRIVMTDFEVGLDLDPSLFSLDVPPGYTVRERQVDVPEKPILGLADTLGLAAEYNGGVFPPSLRGEQGIDGLLTRIGPAMEKKYGKDSPELMEAQIERAKKVGGFGIVQLLVPEHDWHYAGKDVELNTPDRPIFWWKPTPMRDDYEVVYADLSVKDVAAEDLPKVTKGITEAETAPLPDVDEAAFVDAMRAWLKSQKEAKTGIDKMKNKMKKAAQEMKKMQEQGKELPEGMRAMFVGAASDAGYPDCLEIPYLHGVFFTFAAWSNLDEISAEVKRIPEDLDEAERKKAREKIQRAHAKRAAIGAQRVTREASQKAVAIAGFYQNLANEQREPEYFGATVKPGDSAAVLLKWKLDDGRYRVIYGDLRAETVDSRD